MEFKYFKNIRSVDEARRRYSELAKKHHPDKGGDGAVMTEINEEYKKLIEILEYGKDLISRDGKIRINLNPKLKSELIESSGNLGNAVGKSLMDIILDKLTS